MAKPKLSELQRRVLEAARDSGGRIYSDTLFMECGFEDGDALHNACKELIAVDLMYCFGSYIVLTDAGRAALEGKR